MREDTPMTRHPDPEEAWLAALAGKHPPGAPLAPGSGQELAVRSGELIRARFSKALRQVHAAPDPETTRAKILAAAAAGRPAPGHHHRTLALASAAGAGLAAGIVGTLLLQPPHAHHDFADVESSSEIGNDTEMRTASAQTTRTFNVLSSNVPATAADLASTLARSGVAFRVTLPQEGGVLFKVERLSTVPASLLSTASALKIDFPPDTVIWIHIIDRAPK
jgi:hypothetical protein